MKESILSWLFTMLVLAGSSQQPDIVFHHITEKDGLSYNIINCFLKDSRGLLWIGTYNGLNRYDGSHFYIYRKEKAPNTLVNNTVHKLAEDKQGNIWGATDGGIFCYRTRTGDFKNYYRGPLFKTPGTLNITCDQQGVIWATTNDGLIRYNAAADSFVKVPQVWINQQGMSYNSIRKNGLCEDPSGRGFFLATREGIRYYDKTQQQLIDAGNKKSFTMFSGNNSAALTSTRFGHYWYFDNKEKKIIGFDPNQKKVLYTISLPQHLGNMVGATLFEDQDRRLWLSSWTHEIFAIDYLHGTVVNKVSHNDNDITSVAGDFFWDAMQDADGTLWLGTVGGISQSNKTKSFYKVHHLSDSIHGRPQVAITYFTENKKDSTWWVVTEANSLVQYHPATCQVIKYPLGKFPVNASGKRPGWVNAITFFNGKTMLSCAEGAWMQHKPGGPFVPFYLPGNLLPPEAKIAYVKNDTTVYCTDGVRLVAYNPLTGTVSNLDYARPLALQDRQPAIFFINSRPGKPLWMIIAEDWLSYVDKQQLHAVKFSSSNKDGSNGYYTSMDIDQQGNLWIAKKGDGLFYFNPTTKLYRHWKQQDGLVMDHIMTATADNNGKIWSAAYNQFSVFNPGLNSFYNFTLPIATNNYRYNNVMHLLSNGNIICSVLGKLIEFFPSRLIPSPVTGLPVISMMSVNGKEKHPDSKNSLRLTPSGNNVHLKFSMLIDKTIAPYDMQYQLEGAEKSWSTAPGRFEATYNSLPHGAYTFKVRAVARDKSWQTGETTLQIYIDAPFYKSWWFLTLLAILIGLGVYAFYRYRLHQQQQLYALEGKAQLLEKEKTIVLYESLKQQLNPHFLFNSLTSLSGLIETDQVMAGNFLEQMSKIYRYILKSSDTETVLLKEELAFVRVFVSLQQTRFGKGLQVNIDVPDAWYHLKIAPVTLQNLIENAIKHNIMDEDSPLVIDIFVEDSYLVIKNNLQKKKVVETSNEQGLVNMQSLYRYLSDRPLLIEQTTTYFLIKVPLI